MLYSYLKTALRNFSKSRATSLINLFGLALGLATCLVAGLYIKHEFKADQFHRDIADIYYIHVKLRDYTMSGTPYPFAEALQKEAPAVKATLRMANEEALLQIGDLRFRNQVILADSNFFSFFTFPLRYGNPNKALTQLKQVVISEAMRDKYFPDENPVGKTIHIRRANAEGDFEITGVVAQPPAYSSIQFDFMIPLANQYSSDVHAKNEWNSFFLTSFVKVAPDQLPQVEKVTAALVKKNVDFNDKSAMTFVYNPFAKHHLGGGYSDGGMVEGRNPQGLFIFGGIAVAILLLACFNFMNLSVARSSRRVVEVGVRKVVGAGKRQLVRQFLAESLALSVLASVLSLGIAELGLMFFRDLLEASLTVFDVQHVDVYAGLIVVTLIAGVLAGGYPAFVLANVSALQSFKRYFRVSGNNWLTRTVLSVQFAVSIVLIVCALVMWKQQRYLMHKDLGYNHEQVLVVPVASNDTALMPVLKNEVKKLSEVVNASHSTGSFTRGNNVSIHKMPDESNVFIFMIGIDVDYVPTLQLALKEGRAFTEDDVKGSRKILVNEALVKRFHLEDSIGIALGGRLGFLEHPTIIGVLRDFHHSNLRQEIAPLMLIPDETLNQSFLMVRLAPGQIMSGLDAIGAVWKKINPNAPFEYFFLDDDIQKQYNSEMRWSGIITLATGMAIFLSILGLTGLALYSAEQRKKEIGIRKVLGATLGQLVGLLSRDYMWLIAVAFAVAAPLAYYTMTNYWLNNFAYAVTVDAGLYLTAFGLVCLIAGVAVGSQTLRAARQNPVDTLKEE